MQRTKHHVIQFIMIQKCLNCNLRTNVLKNALVQVYCAISEIYVHPVFQTRQFKKEKILKHF